mgnify:CR=1 FL=1
MLEKEYNMGPFSFEVIYTPGHTKEEITYYFKKENIMFTGDFIFKDGIGRCDLSGGNYIEMMKSLEKMKKYDSNIKIFPGHGMDSNLKMELVKYL